MHYSKHGYSCKECGKPFKTFTLLRYHQRVHTAEKPYVCPREPCDKMFSSSKSLRNHLQKHQKEDGKGDQTNASTTIKKKKSKGNQLSILYYYFFNRVEISCEIMYSFIRYHLENTGPDILLWHIKLLGSKGSKPF